MADFARTELGSVQLVTVATEETDGYLRFVESCKINQFPLVVLGMGEPWSWDSAHVPGGGKKVNYLKQYLTKFADDDQRLILFTDAYDVIVNDTPREIIRKFLSFDVDILFTAEPNIWPDPSLESEFPRLDSNPYIYLNSGGIIASIQTWKLVTEKPIKDEDDDQLYYQLIYLRDRGGISMALDHTCQIFQTLSRESLFSTIQAEHGQIINLMFPQSKPSIIHGNGGIKSKLFLNSLGNYIPMIKLKPGGHHHIVVLVHMRDDQGHQWRQNYDNCQYIYYGGQLRSSLNEFHQTSSNEDVRQLIIDTLEKYKPDYFFFADTNHVLTDTGLLRKLISTEKDLIAPALHVQGKYYANFWGAIGSDGYYRKSDDYYDIVDRKKTGIWNMPYVNGSILLSYRRSRDVLKLLQKHPIGTEDFDMYWSRILRNHCIFQYVINEEDYGYMEAAM